MFSVDRLSDGNGKDSPGENVVTRGIPLTAGVSCPKVVSMSPWETSRPSGVIGVWFGPECGRFYGRGRR